MAGVAQALAISDNTVEIAFNGSSATVTKASNIASYVTETVSGASVSITQAETAGENTSGEIIYILSGSSSEGSFSLTGSYKCTIQLNGLSLTNPNGPALDIQNGKRIRFSAVSGTVNTLTDGEGGDWKGCITCKGHIQLRGRGTLNVTGNNGHAIWAKEYVEIKNCTINIPSAVKDGINCNQYFSMESGTLSITSTGDDGIQVSLKGTESTGAIDGHEAADGTTEDSGNFYQNDGTITMSETGGYCIKTEGTITYSGGTQTFDKTNVLENATSGISSVQLDTNGDGAVYDLNGRRIPGAAVLPKGLYIVREGTSAKKVLVK